jgi:hypothetical protein
MFFSRQEGPAEEPLRLLHSGLKRVMTCLPDFAWGLDRPIGHVRGMSACPSKATIARNTLTRRSVPIADSLPLLAVPPQTASVQLSENANADVEKGRPSLLVQANEVIE